MDYISQIEEYNKEIRAIRWKIEQEGSKNECIMNAMFLVVHQCLQENEKIYEMFDAFNLFSENDRDITNGLREIIGDRLTGLDHDTIIREIIFYLLDAVPSGKWALSVDRFNEDLFILAPPARFDEYGEFIHIEIKTRPIIYVQIIFTIYDKENENKKQLISKPMRLGTGGNLYKKSLKLINSKLKFKFDVQNPETETNLKSHHFIIAKMLGRCLNTEHNLQLIRAVVNVKKNNEKIVPVEVPALYCEKCNKYYILLDDYKFVLSIGEPLCRIITEYKWLEILARMGVGDQYGELLDQSVLMLSGYSVSKQKGLSEQERQDILSFIIENKIATAGKVIDYLEYFINLRSCQPAYSDAISKWEKDKSYVKHNYLDSYQKILVDSIKRNMT